MIFSFLSGCDDISLFSLFAAGWLVVVLPADQKLFFISIFYSTSIQHYIFVVRRCIRQQGKYTNEGTDTPKIILIFMWQSFWCGGNLSAKLESVLHSLLCLLTAREFKLEIINISDNEQLLGECICLSNAPNVTPEVYCSHFFITKSFYIYSQ